MRDGKFGSGNSGSATLLVGCLSQGADVPVCEVQAEVVHLLDQAKDVPMLHPHTVLQYTSHQLFQKRVVTNYCNSSDVTRIY
jgi:hypothetical protein